MNPFPYVEPQTYNDAIRSMTDTEKIQYRNMLDAEDKPFIGTRVTLFFPEKYNLKPVDFVGQVPVKGQIVYVRNLDFRVEEDRDFNGRQKWRVKDVWISMYAPGTTKEDMLGVPVPRAEVILGYDHKWQDFSAKTWWPIRRKIRDFFSNLWNKILRNLPKK